MNISWTAAVATWPPSGSEGSGHTLAAARQRVPTLMFVRIRFARALDTSIRNNFNRTPCRTAITEPAGIVKAPPKSFKGSGRGGMPIPGEIPGGPKPIVWKGMVLNSKVAAPRAPACCAHALPSEVCA